MNDERQFVAADQQIPDRVVPDSLWIEASFHVMRDGRRSRLFIHGVRAEVSVIGARGMVATCQGQLRLMGRLRA